MNNWNDFTYIFTLVGLTDHRVKKRSTDNWYISWKSAEKFRFGEKNLQGVCLETTLTS